MRAVVVRSDSCRNVSLAATSSKLATILSRSGAGHAQAVLHLVDIAPLAHHLRGLVLLARAAQLVAAQREVGLAPLELDHLGVQVGLDVLFDEELVDDVLHGREPRGRRDLLEARVVELLRHLQRAQLVGELVTPLLLGLESEPQPLEAVLAARLLREGTPLTLALRLGGLIAQAARDVAQRVELAGQEHLVLPNLIVKCLHVGLRAVAVHLDAQQLLVHLLVQRVVLAHLLANSVQARKVLRIGRTVTDRHAPANAVSGCVSQALL